jgi:hypothetical protein
LVLAPGSAACHGPAFRHLASSDERRVSSYGPPDGAGFLSAPIVWPWPLRRRRCRRRSSSAAWAKGCPRPELPSRRIPVDPRSKVVQSRAKKLAKDLLRASTGRLGEALCPPSTKLVIFSRGADRLQPSCLAAQVASPDPPPWRSLGRDLSAARLLQERDQQNWGRAVLRASNTAVLY